MRRYKYLEKMFEEEMKKVLVFMKGFSPLERIKLARMTALWISNGSVPPTVLSVLINEHLVKDNLALDFLMEVFVTWKQEKGLSSLMTALKRGGIEGRLMEFVPPNKRSEEHFRSVFEAVGLADIVKLHKAQASQEAKRDLQQLLLDHLADNRPIKDIVLDLKEMALRCSIPEHEVIGLVSFETKNLKILGQIAPAINPNKLSFFWPLLRLLWVVLDPKHVKTLNYQ